MGFLCGPVAEDTHTTGRQFATTMWRAPVVEPGCCLLACTCCPCTQYVLREKVLDGDLSKYTCCQGYCDIWCFKAGCCGEEKCPKFCLACESCFCLSCALSSTRNHLMDRLSLISDPMDRFLIRVSNCLQLLSLFCDFVYLLTGECGGCSDVMRVTARIFFCCVCSCMSAQVYHELELEDAHRITATWTATEAATKDGSGGGGVGVGVTKTVSTSTSTSTATEPAWSSGPMPATMVDSSTTTIAKPRAQAMMAMEAADSIDNEDDTTATVTSSSNDSVSDSSDSADSDGYSGSDNEDRDDYKDMNGDNLQQQQHPQRPQQQQQRRRRYVARPTLQQRQQQQKNECRENELQQQLFLNLSL